MIFLSSVDSFKCLQATKTVFPPTDAWGRSQLPRGLRCRSAPASLLGLWVRIQSEIWMSVRCECCVLSIRGLCDGLITRKEESYRLCYVVVCDLENSWMRRPWPTGGCRPRKKKERKKERDVSCRILLVFNLQILRFVQDCTSTRKHGAFPFLSIFWKSLLLCLCTLMVLRHLVFLGVVQVVFSPDLN